MRIKKVASHMALLLLLCLVSINQFLAQENKNEKEDRLKRQPEMLINADAEKVAGIIVKGMTEAKYNLEKEGKYQLVFRKKIGGASGFFAGALMGRDAENPHEIITFVLVKEGDATLVSATAAILYPNKNNEGIPRNVDNKKTRKELWKNLDTIKELAEKK
jgi:hypothetical protein